MLCIQEIRDAVKAEYVQESELANAAAELRKIIKENASFVGMRSTLVVRLFMGLRVLLPIATKQEIVQRFPNTGILFWPDIDQATEYSLNAIVSSKNCQALLVWLREVVFIPNF